MTDLGDDAHVEELIRAQCKAHAIKIVHNVSIDRFVVNSRTNVLEGLQCQCLESSRRSLTRTEKEDNDENDDDDDENKDREDNNTYNNDQNRVNGNDAATRVSITTADNDVVIHNIHVPCDILLCCNHDDVDPDAFRAMNDSGLVYDGRLVVNANFQTTDPFIYAGGSGCRFSRRFPTALYQEHYSARECGAFLAASLLNVVDPLVVSQQNEIQGTTAESIDHDHRTTKRMPPPKFSIPRVTCGYWPDGFYYVQINLPDIPSCLRSLTTNSSDNSNYWYERNSNDRNVHEVTV